MNKMLTILCCLGLVVTSCSTHKFPSFSTSKWNIDQYSGNAVSNSGLEFGFGCEWMIKDTTLIQSSEQLERYSKLADYLNKAIGRFPEIFVDSIYFYNPARGLLFASYHHNKPLKPTAEVSLCADSMAAYSKEYARIFGQIHSFIDDEHSWENGPFNSVYSNLRYDKKNKQFVLLQRIPYKGQNVAVFHICSSIPQKGKWWEEYPEGVFWNVDFGNTDNIEIIAFYLNSARTTAVSNLQINESKK